jgi:predicted ribosome quality control (RQC) complex YloA/Tae2 family protein
MAPAALQAMDLTSLRAVLSELQPLLVPSRFEKAQQADAQTLQLGFRTLRQRLWLEFGWRRPRACWPLPRRRARVMAAPSPSSCSTASGAWRW